jgi:hypothetical protein
MIATRPLPGRTGTGKAPATAKQSSGGPTPERLAQRQAMAEGGDAALTTTPLDVALLRGRISMAQHAAGRQYAFLWHASGHQTPRSSAIDLDRERSLPGLSVADMSETTAERIRLEFEASRETVRRAVGPGGVAVLEDLVIYEKWPSWAWTSKNVALSASQVSARDCAAKALTALSGLLAGSQRPSSAKVRTEPKKRIPVSVPDAHSASDKVSYSAFDDDAADTDAELLRLIDAELAGRRTNGVLPR